MRELYPQLGLGVPGSDKPKPRPRFGGEGESSDSEKHTVRWGDCDNRIFNSCDDRAIKDMVLSMVETSKLTGGYMMCIGNYIPWNVPAQGIKAYLDYSAKFAHR